MELYGYGTMELMASMKASGKHGLAHLRGHAKVRELHAACLGQQDVAALDVAVHLAQGVQVREALRARAQQPR